jgi:uncharacterized protein (TIGR03437 family)
VSNERLSPVILVLTIAWSSPVSLAQTLANEFLDDATVQVIRLTMDPVDWAALQAHYLENTYYVATFQWKGITVNNVGVRSHGTGSRSPVKPNLDLDFDKYDKNQRFLGLPWIIIKANNEDPSNLREWITMKMFRRLGLPAPREAPAQVYLNGQVLGFYMIVEHLDETFIQRNFGEETGYLYEFKANGSYEFEDLGTDPSVYSPLLDLKTHQSSPNLQNFMNLVEVINRPSSASFTDAQFIAALSAYLDPRLFLTHIAIESVMNEADGICGGVVGMSNFYLYQFHNQTLYQMIAWDKDETFSTLDTDILNGITKGTHINLLAQRLVGIGQYRSIFFDSVAKVAATLGGSGGWADNEINREYAIMHSAAVNDPHKQCGSPNGLVLCGAREFENDVQWLHTFLAQRTAVVMAGLAANGYIPGPAGPSISDGGITVWGGMRALSPGAVAVISGKGFGPEAPATALPLPRTLGNTFAAVEGVRAPLFEVTPGTVQILVPGDLATGSAGVVISNDGALTNSVVVPVQAATPAIAAVVHANGFSISRANPPVSGEVLVIYAVGLGAASTNLPIDAAAPLDPPATTAAAPQVLLGGLPMTVVFSGLTPGYLGLYQVNAVAPENLPSNAGSLPFVLTQSGQTAVWQYSAN